MLDGVPLQAGDSVTISDGPPPIVQTVKGAAGRIVGSPAKEIEACQRFRFRFSGVVLEVGDRSALLRIRGERSA